MGLMFTDDPHVRYPSDPPPLVPWTNDRFRWPERGDPEVSMIRDRVQDHGRGLYLLRTPYYGGKVLVEAYYPEDLRDHYKKDWLDPYRMEDAKQGRLVVLNVLEKIKSSSERLTMEHIREIRRNNRNARAALKRQVTPSYRKQELEDARKTEEGVIYDNFTEWWANRKRDTIKYAMTPHVGPARNLALGGH